MFAEFANLIQSDSENENISEQDFSESLKAFSEKPNSSSSNLSLKLSSSSEEEELFEKH